MRVPDPVKGILIIAITLNTMIAFPMSCYMTKEENMESIYFLVSAILTGSLFWYGIYKFMMLYINEVGDKTTRKSQIKD